ncbi:dienelactone hydrolase family protein [Roseiterribacter gracilis]|uniref:Dienelactone hydrolase n=1 Tax=Roseiterribacter gracilis TaxID=2812848 RepID=A0A8S8XH73_9PROT|nr:dienelactone hydrolase [Rhodospirillales bacterium TMPK1]
MADVSIPPLDKRDPALTGVLLRPASNKPAPAIVMLHGCDGMYGKNGNLSARSRDWAERFVAQGYVVLLPDSFAARGVTSACNASETRARARVERPRDALASLAYLRSLPFVRGDALALAGWSHGGSTVVAVAGESHGLEGVRSAVAFYPNCKPILERRDWKAQVPLAMLIGDADAWSTPRECQQLAERERLDLVLYPGAVHGFDNPDMKRTTRTGITTPGGGTTAELGTDPVARADAIKRVTARFLTALKP